MKWHVCRFRTTYKGYKLEVLKAYSGKWWIVIHSKKNLYISHKDMVHDYDTKEEAFTACKEFAKRFHKEGRS